MKGRANGTLRRSAGLILGASAFVGVCAAANTAMGAAQTYTITTTSMTISNNNNCTFPEALQAVATRRAVDRCVAGGGSASSPDVIKLQGGATYQIPGTLKILASVNIQSATANNMAILAQVGPPSDIDTGATILIDLPATGAANVTLQDIDVKGNNSGTAIGLGIFGNDISDVVTLNRSWVEKFAANGIFDQNASLTLNDSAIDGNGSAGTGFGNGSGIFIESTGGQPSTHLTLNNSSITNNLEGGIETELASGSVSTIKNSTIADNHGGSGIEAGGGFGGFHVNIYGSTIFFNATDYLNRPGSGSDSNHGIRNYQGFVTIDQTVVDTNLGPFGSAADYVGNLDTMKNSILGNSEEASILQFIGTNITDIDSQLDLTLRDNGGSGQRHPRTHKPLHQSIAIDFTSSADSTVGSQDQRHRPRGFDFVSGGNRFDVGAVELQSGE